MSIKSKLVHFTTVYIMVSHHVCYLAHSRRCRRWWPVFNVTRFLSGRFPCHTFHRVQWCPWHMPLLCQQVQFLADHSGSERTVHRGSIPRNAERRSVSLTNQSLSGLHEDLVIHIRKVTLQVKEAFKDSKQSELTDMIICL